MISPLYGQLSPLRIPTSSRFISADADVVSYILAVEAGDGQQLEAGVITAVESFVVGCKSDGIWSAIKASCIIAGARTLSGAIVPLVGTAPTNFNFVSADYNRKTGLKGNTSKSLATNRLNNTDPQNSKHAAIYASETSGVQFHNYLGGTVASGTTQFRVWDASRLEHRINTGSAATLSTNSAGFIGSSRGSASSIVTRGNGQNFTSSSLSETPSSQSLRIFSASTGANSTTARISYYSIGESLDLAALDTRVSTLMTDLAAAIP